MIDRKFLSILSDADVEAFRASGEFDEQWYLNEYPDVTKTGIDPALHYLWIGIRLNRKPSAIFTPPQNTETINSKIKVDIPIDSGSNRSKTTIGRKTKSVLIREARNIVRKKQPSLENSHYEKLKQYFDYNYYLSKYPDVRADGIDPLTHYIEHGEQEGRNPNSSFSPLDYLVLNQDVNRSGMSPFLHYALHGRSEGRLTFSKEKTPTVRHRPSAPRMEQFEKVARLQKGLSKSSTIETEIVDVIIPVYRGFNDTLACIYSVLTDQTRTPREIIVINDCSPEPELTNVLRALASLNLFTLLENEENVGFVGTVNRGMEVHPNRDVLLLNSDTEVFNDWLDRIVFHGRKEQVASVTPFSNNATICSYPKFVSDNPVPLELNYSDLDLLFSKINFQQSIEIPTAVGFCMFIQRSAIEHLGLFDYEAFGKGYGEENDFCMRAINAGWTNLAALDVFVRHTGETSFAENASASQKRGLDELVRLHPNYLEIIQSFIRKDPARMNRRIVDIERLKLATQAYDRTLCITHNWGGGIKRYINDRMSFERENNRGLIVCSPGADTNGALTIELNAAQPLDLNNLIFDAENFDENSDFIESLKALNVRRLEVHSLVGWPFSAIDRISALANALKLPYKVMLHDYTPICPQTNLVNDSNLYCGEKGVYQCISCLKINSKISHLVHPGAPNFEMVIDIVEWRKSYRNLLINAESVLAPSKDTKCRFLNYIPELSIEVAPHREESIISDESLAVPFYPDEPLRVAIIGAIGPHKGSNILKEIAIEALKTGKKIEYVVIGYTDNDAYFSTIENIEITGRYNDSDVMNIIREKKCNIALIPSVWPETYSYTFSIAVGAGLPTVVFNIGAQGERSLLFDIVKAVPLDLAHQPDKLNAALISWAHLKTPRI